ncbi:tripartite motif-containing protein 16-like [Toxotes jaculatrix]|uniref:tripartite motif-containing protein 16-like n=1 Tax=Toxotes jaculatrix TaxID=941984 RepID=UPI001B3AAB89|nr:tripartite motif-containing protein 16-like [Toxotes jaculatrix]
MAQQADQLDREKFSCSICLDLLKDPVTIPCGHSYCMDCIKSHWSEAEYTQSCPQCRQTFRPRPALVKNTMLADLVEDLKKTGASAEPADHRYAGPEDVACDFCTGRKLKALKSCLQCLVSYCEQHLQPHYESPSFEKHKLVHPSKKIQENICTRHNEVMKIFCRTDQQCICYLCSMDEHKGHDTVSAVAEMTKRQRELKLNQQKIHQRIQDREKDVKVLQQEVEAINSSADKAVMESGKLSTELVTLIERRSSALKRKIRFQQETEVSQAKKLREKLEQELVELRRNSTELEKLSHTEDQTQFLQNCTSLSPLIKRTTLPIFNTRPLQYFENVRTTASQAKRKLWMTCDMELDRISETVTGVNVLLLPDPKTRAEFLQYAVPKKKLTLNPNTANTKLMLFEGKRKVSLVKDEQFYCGHPDRFMDKSQVLSEQHLTGRCYWEVQWRGLGVSVAVAYKDIARTGQKSEFGDNDKSWVLECSSNGNYKFRHNGVRTNLSERPPSSALALGQSNVRVGVFLDYNAGILSFYKVSETITVLLHRVRIPFTQPLYAGFGVYYFGSTAEFYEVK